jgi:glycosyltransferase involved in cell wall biosynthesis
MNVSVIICTWNNAPRLATTLEAFQKCNVAGGIRWELIVVNNNCSDETDETIEAFAHALPIVHVREPRQGLSHARNAGLQAASGQLALFTDDDVKPVSKWIDAYWECFLSKPAGHYFGGPVESEFESAPPDPELIPLAPHSVKGLDLGTEARPLLTHEFFIGPNWACPTQAARTAGGFDPAKGLNPARSKVRVGEETDLMSRLKRLGLSGWYVPKAKIIHTVPAAKCTLAHIAERAEAYGEYAAAQYAERETAACSRSRPPMWMYRMALEYWVKWLSEKALGRKGYVNYIAWREMLGRIRAFRAMSL